MFEFDQHTHKRYNPLTKEWVLVSPHRTKRPWQGKTEEAAKDTMPQYDPNCYLCPGNKRAGGFENPKYESTFTFVNDFSALIEDVPQGELNKENLLIAKSEKGLCKVICFSPRHDLTLARMEIPAICGVIKLWQNEYKELGTKPYIKYVQIFENRGAIMGCSNPHPHGQIWANETVPDIPQKESESQLEHFNKHGRPLLLDYLDIELKEQKRIIYQNDSFVVLVPFWAVWPYELMILPKTAISNISQLNEAQITDLAKAMKYLGVKYDNLFLTNFPYSMGIHQAPTDSKEHPEWQLHFHYMPPLLRSATVKKFMVGYELMATPQRDITPEQAASTLCSLPEIHYLEK